MTRTVGLFRGFDTGLQFSMHTTGSFLGHCLQTALPDWRFIEQYDAPRLFKGRTIETTSSISFKVDRYLLPRRRFGAVRPDLLAISDHSDAYVSFAVGAPRTFVVCHDVLPRLLELGLLEGRRPSRFGRLLMAANGKAMARADRVICVSHSTRRDLIAHFDIDPDRVEVIYNYALVGLEQDGAAPVSPAVGAALADPRPYVLSVGGGKPCKNLKIIPDVLKDLTTACGLDVRWIVVGDRDFDPEPLGGRVQFVKGLSGSDLAALYRSAGAFFFPSLYEGFGLPIVEAQAYGAPVVGSNRGSLPEVIGGAGLMVDPHDLRGASEALARILTDSALRDEMIAAGKSNVLRFSKETRVKQYVSALVRTAYE